MTDLQLKPLLNERQRRIVDEILAVCDVCGGCPPTILLSAVAERMKPSDGEIKVILHKLLEAGKIEFTPNRLVRRRND